MRRVLLARQGETQAASRGSGRGAAGVQEHRVRVQPVRQAPQQHAHPVCAHPRPLRWWWVTRCIFPRPTTGWSRSTQPRAARFGSSCCRLQQRRVEYRIGRVMERTTRRSFVGTNDEATPSAVDAKTGGARRRLRTKRSSWDLKPESPTISPDKHYAISTAPAIYKNIAVDYRMPAAGDAARRLPLQAMCVGGMS